MAFYLNYYASETIRRNGTLIKPLSCCDSVIASRDKRCFFCGASPIVTLRGLRNQTSQTWKWQIFMGKIEGEPIALLTCAYCLKEVKTKNRQCQCGAYCLLRIEWYNGKWELHRDVAMEHEPDSDGIVIETVEATQNSCTDAPPLDFSEYDLTLGGLYCPFQHPFSYLGMTDIDENARCNGHEVQVSAVLVFRENGIFVERRAHNFNTGEPREIDDPNKIRPKQLKCPMCSTAIVDKTLICSRCKIYIIDVVQKPPTTMHRPSDCGLYTQIFIEIEPRLAFETTRPENALVMEGDNWMEQVQAPQAPETPAPQHKSHKAIYQEYIELKAKDPELAIRPAAEIIGIKHPKLQYVIQKMKKKAEEEKPLNKYEIAKRKWKAELEQEKQKRRKKPPKWF